MPTNPNFSELNETVLAEENFVDQAYEILVSQEVSSTPDPKEKIPSGRLNKGDYEYEVLLSQGVPEYKILEGNITREELLESGFVFNNYPFAHVEKPLINVEINGVDFGNRKFITKEELQIIKEYQRNHPDLYGDESIESDEVRKDMLSLLLSSNIQLPIHVENKINFLRVCANEMDFPYESLYDIPSVRKDSLTLKINGLYKELWAIYKDNNFRSENPAQDEEAFIENNLSDLLFWQETHSFDWYSLNIRGLKARYVDSRNKKLNGLPSPFLESGYHFGSPFNNPDFTVIGKDGKPFRVNFMVLHLLSEGISEMSNKDREDRDQDYSMGNYMNNLYDENPTVREDYLRAEVQKFEFIKSFKEEELMAAVQARMKAASIEWANSSQNRRAKTLLSQIDKLQRKKEGNIYRFRMPNVRSLLKTI